MVPIWELVTLGNYCQVGDNKTAPQEGTFASPTHDTVSHDDELTQLGRTLLEPCSPKALWTNEN